MDSAGNLTTSLDQVGTAFVTYFMELFGQERDLVDCQANILNTGRCVLPDEATKLVAQVSAMEIKDAVFDMGDDKAPGPDGYSAAFFKKNWATVGDSVTVAILEFFRNGKLLKQWNHTTIALIPKSPNAQAAADYRPIACCNVTYKIITKILAKRMACLLPSIIDPAQGAFVGGRCMSDNIFLAQELIRGYGRKRTASRCMIMVDLRKAYDTIDWKFLCDVLRGLGFPEQFVNWIFECISTTTFSVSINGILKGFFPGKRGIRQGDPMSPMLFTICLEYFSRLVKHKISTSSFCYHPNCKEVGISHLAFADDLMLFSRGDTRSVEILMEALKQFEEASGLTVSIEKSKIFHTGCPRDRFDFTGLTKGTLPVRYLGIPLDAQRLKVAYFSPLIQAISNHIDAWKGCTLSYAGRLELLRAIVQGVVGFWLQHFPLPTCVINHIVSICRKFLWGNKMAVVAWDDLCMPIEEGGLGLRNYNTWNYAFIAKALWNIHSKKDTLWVQWIHEYYLEGTNLWTWQPKKEHSPHIKSIIMVRDLLVQKLGGVSSTIHTLTDWAPNNDLSSAKIYDVLRTHGAICRDLKFVWKNFIPPKYSFIAWLALRNRLRTRDRLFSMETSGLCPLCNQGMESADHLFFRCTFSLQVWNKIRDWSGFRRRTTAIRSTIKWISREYRGTRIHSKQIALALIGTIYHIWKTRNGAIFDGDIPSVDRIVNTVEKDVYKVLYNKYPMHYDFL